MFTRLLRAWKGLQSSLPTRRQSTVLVAVSAICVVTPLISFMGLQRETQKLVSDPPASPEQQLLYGRYRVLEQQHAATITLIAVTASLGLLSSLMTFYLLHRLYQALYQRTNQWQESNTLLQAIENSLPDSLFTLNAQGYIETFNPAATQMFGYDPTDIVGKPLNLLVEDMLVEQSASLVEQPSTEDNCDRSLQSLRSHRRIAHHKSGASFPIELSLDTAIPQQRHVAIVRDLTYHDRIEAELRSRLEDLAQVTADLTQARVDLQTVYMTCHDLKSPLQAILHLSQWLQADLRERVRADTQNQFNLLQERVRRLEGLVENILESAPPQETIHH